LPAVGILGYLGPFRKLGDLGHNTPLVASKSYTTDANFSCLLPSILEKFIYLLFISYGGERRFKGPETWEPSHRDQRALSFNTTGVCLGLAMQPAGF
jgi:hypothetical protein